MLVEFTTTNQGNSWMDSTVHTVESVSGSWGFLHSRPHCGARLPIQHTGEGPYTMCLKKESLHDR